MYRKKKKKILKKEKKRKEGKEQEDAGRGGEQKQASDPHSSEPLVKGGSPSREPNPEISSGFVQQVASVLRPPQLLFIFIYLF